MTASYITDRPEQQQLLPSALQDWLSRGHLAYFIDNTVDSLNLAAFHARPAKGGPGNQPFRSAMMVSVTRRAGGGFNYSFTMHRRRSMRRLTPSRPPTYSTPARTCSNCTWCLISGHSNRSAAYASSPR